MSRYSSESSSYYETGKDPKHKHRTRIYDHDGKVIKDSVRDTRKEPGRTSLLDERIFGNLHGDIDDIVRAKRPRRPTDPSGRREEGTRRHSKDSDKSRHRDSLDRGREERRHRSWDSDRERGYRGRDTSDDRPGQAEDRRSSWDSDRERGRKGRDTSDDRPGQAEDRRSSYDSKNSTRRHYSDERSRRSSDPSKNAGSAENAPPVCVVPPSDKHRHHHHRVHHHRHYKKLIFYWPFGGKEGVPPQIQDQQQRRLREPQQGISSEQQNIKPSEEPEQKLSESKTRAEDYNDANKNGKCERKQVADDTTSVSRILRPKLTDRDVAIGSSDEMDMMYDGGKPKARGLLGRLFGTTGEEEEGGTAETDDGSFQYEQVPLPGTEDRNPYQPPAAVVEGTDCPFCGQGKFRRKFTWTGVMASILLFPCGIYCCFKYRVPVCTYCGVSPL